MDSNGKQIKHIMYYLNAFSFYDPIHQMYIYAMKSFAPV